MNNYVYAPFALGFVCVGTKNQAISTYEVKNCELQLYLSDRYNLPAHAKIYFSLTKRLSGSAFTTLLSFCKIHDENRQRGFDSCSNVSMAPAAHIKKLLNRSNSGKSTAYIEEAVLELSQTEMVFTALIDGEEHVLINSPILTYFHNGKLSVSDGKAYSLISRTKTNRHRNWSFCFSEVFQTLLKKDNDQKHIFQTTRYDLKELTQYRSDSIDLQIMAHLSASSRGEKGAFPKTIMKLMKRLGYVVEDIVKDRKELKTMGQRLKKAIKRIPTIYTVIKDSTYKNFIYQTLIHEPIIKTNTE